MRVGKAIVPMVFSGMLVLFLSLPAMADEWNKETVVTVNQPVEVPGMVLKAGTYEFNPAVLAAKTAGAQTESVSTETVSKSVSLPQQTNAPAAFPGKLSSVPVEHHESVQLAQATTQTKPEASSTAAPSQTQTLKQLPKTANSLPLLAGWACSHWAGPPDSTCFQNIPPSSTG